MEEAYLQIAGIVRESIVDGPGIRFTVFCQGCPHHCPGCHNPQTHPFDGGQQAGVSRLVKEIRKNPLLQGVTFSGGEPFCQPGAFAALSRREKAVVTAFIDIRVQERERLLRQMGMQAV